MKKASSPFSLLERSLGHLASVREGYFEHMRFAIAVGGLMIGAGIACIVHALVPAAFETTASRTIRRLHAVLEDRRQLNSAREEGPPAGFLPLLALSLAAAALPWLAGSAAAVAAPLSLIALALPIAFLATEAIEPGSDR